MMREVRTEIPAMNVVSILKPGVVELKDYEMQMMDKYLHEEKVEFICEWDENADYNIYNPDGTVTKVAKCVTINGIRHNIVPGKNLIPRSVYEFLLQTFEDAQQKIRVLPCGMPAAQPNKTFCLGEMLGTSFNASY